MITAACAANKVSNGGAMAGQDRVDLDLADNSGGNLRHLLHRKARRALDRTPHRALVQELSSNKNIEFRSRGLSQAA